MFLISQLLVATALAQTTPARDADAGRPAVVSPAALIAREIERERQALQAKQPDATTPEASADAAAATGGERNTGDAGGLQGGSGNIGAQALAGDGRRSLAPPISARLSLFAGEAAVRRVPGEIRRVAVGNGDVLSAFTVGKDELVLIGTAAGDTNVHLWLASGAQRDISVSVAGIKGDNLAATVRRLMGDVPGMVVEPIGSNIVVTGVEMDEA
ncbi:MAG TPA: pilus assembly protein N-terminal domain-containing protein, partial [Luteimonas sp.]|nr:pilus assembly protein N-terminal domain-containing protein [Luteimonas sp.]